MSCHRFAPLIRRASCGIYVTGHFCMSVVSHSQLKKESLDIKWKVLLQLGVSSFTPTVYQNPLWLLPIPLTNPAVCLNETNHCANMTEVRNTWLTALVVFICSSTCRYSSLGLSGGSSFCSSFCVITERALSRKTKNSLLLRNMVTVFMKQQDRKISRKLIRLTGIK